MDEIVKNALYGLEPTPPIPKGLKEPSEEPKKSWAKRLFKKETILTIILMILVFIVFFFRIWFWK
jgi:hypothetical protein